VKFRFKAITAELDPYHTLSEKAFDEIVEKHGFSSDDDDLIQHLHSEGWMHCLTLREDEFGEYVHEKPEPNRFTRILDRCTEET
jgi:hypothetical protein